MTNFALSNILFCE